MLPSCCRRAFAFIYLLFRRASVQERAASHLRRVEARAGERAVRGGGQPAGCPLPLDLQQLGGNDPGPQG